MVWVTKPRRDGIRVSLVGSDGRTSEMNRRIMCPIRFSLIGNWRREILEIKPTLQQKVVDDCVMNKREKPCAPTRNLSGNLAAGTARCDSTNQATKQMPSPGTENRTTNVMCQSLQEKTGRVSCLLTGHFRLVCIEDTCSVGPAFLTDISGICVGCDVVQADHAPEAGVAQGIFHGILVRHHGRNQEEVEEELEEEVERDKEEGDQTTTCTCMDGMR